MTVNHRSRIQPTPHRRRASETDSQRGSYHDESYPHHLDRIHLFSIAHPITIFNPSSPRPGNDAGLPRSNRPVVAFPPVNAERPNREGRDAHDALTRKLRRNNLRRRARKGGLELRHSAYGYSLIDASRKRVEGRATT